MTPRATTGKGDGALTNVGQLLPSGYLHTRGSEIVSESGERVRLAGGNWYGFDCSGMVPGGLDYRGIDDVCRIVVELGFNHVRLPYCVQAVVENPRISAGMAREPSLRGAPVLEIMDAVVQTCGRHGPKVILASMRSEAGWSLQSNGLWYTREYPEDIWLQVWETLVRRYQGNATVIGCDLRNEPSSPPMDPNAWPQNGGSVWGYGGAGRDWAAAAERAGNRILAINPNLLIVVEGVRFDPAGPFFAGSRQLYWPGGNLVGVKRSALPQRFRGRRIRLDVPDRLVYSVHDYGPDMYGGLAWCRRGATASTPESCRAVWDQTWGFIARENIAPVLVGEFGTPNGHKPGDRQPAEHYTHPNPNNPQGAWFTYLVDYIAELGIHWSYWCLNGTQSPAPGRAPSKPDWYGVLTPDWSSVASESMIERLQRILI